jgi:hypothetical protein
MVIFNRQVFEVNVMRVSIHHNASEEMFFEE